MYTDCPACARQFRIRAEQLSAANGEVKCGYCGEQFNALSRLRDRPLSAHELSVPVVREQQYAEPEPQFYIPGDESVPETDEENIPEPRVRHGIEPALEHDSVNDINFQIDNDVESDPEYEFPDELLAQEPGRGSWIGRLTWTMLLLLVLLAAGAQLAWFNRDEVLSRYPDAIPWARQLCERFQCELIRYRDVGAIKILNRDVRDHPRYEKALLVNATIVNRARIIQPFPRIQLGLFDTNGKLLAYREFASEDYLDESIDIENGMTPDMLTHVILEVIGPTEGAVSFEFRFL